MSEPSRNPSLREERHSTCLHLGPQHECENPHCRVKKCKVISSATSCKYIAPERISMDITEVFDKRFTIQYNSPLIVLWERFFNKISAYTERIKNKNVDSRNASETEMGRYHFIQNKPEKILDLLAAAKTLWQKDSGYVERNPTFLDCGAGPGNVVMLAAISGFDAFGIEYDSKTVEKGHKIIKSFGFKNEKEMLFQGNILTYNFFGYYDFIYGFCPLLRGSLEDKFEERMKRTAKVGAIILGMPIYPPQQVTKFYKFQEIDIAANGRTVIVYKKVL